MIAPQATGSLLRLSAVLALALGATGCAAADLRSEALVDEGATPERVERGRELLAAAAERHGLDAWRSRRTTEVTLRDDWASFLAVVTFSKPWDAEDLFALRFENGTFNAQAVFLEGRRAGQTIGLQAWRRYRRAPDGALTWDVERNRAGFVLPALVYFVELPFRLLDAPVVVFDETATFEGRPCDKVLATWGAPEPQPGLDQYVLWIDRETELVRRADFTVREEARFVAFTVFYDDYRTVDGVRVPFLQTVSAAEEAYRDDFAHQVRVESVRYDAFDVAELYPDPERTRVGDAKPGG